MLMIPWAFHVEALYFGISGEQDDGFPPFERRIRRFLFAELTEIGAGVVPVWFNTGRSPPSWGNPAEELED